MPLKRLLGLVVLLTLLMISAACDKTETTPKSAASGVSAPSAVPAGSNQQAPRDAAPPPAEPIVTIPQGSSFRTSLKTISFAEEEDRASRSLKGWISPRLPDEPSKVVYHWDRVSIVLEFSDASDDEDIAKLLSQAQIDGAKPEFSRIDRYGKQFRLLVERPVGASFELKLGDLPAITVERAVALTFTPVTEAGQPAVNQLLLLAREYGAHLLVPMEDKSVTLRFSEAMKPTMPLTNDNSPVPAEWLDDRNLRILLEEKGTLTDKSLTYHLRLVTMEANSGNRLSDQLSLELRRMPAAAWKYSRTGKAFNVGSRGRFYDQIIGSPNGSDYVGVVGLGGSMGDGDGYSYAFVLERSGLDPVVIEHVFYSTIEPDDAPIRWIDADTLLYASYYGVYAFDTAALKTRLLHAASPDEHNNINYAAWDANRSELLVLAYADRNDTSTTSAFTYAKPVLKGSAPGSAPSVVRGSFSESVLIQKYSLLDLAIHPQPGGVYWTRVEQGVPYTDFITDDGTRYTTRGVVRLAAPDRAYVQRYAAGDYLIQPDGWTLWRPGQSERTMAEPPGPGMFFRSGDELIARIEETYYRYDPARDEWPVWTAPGGESRAEPVRGPDGLYKVYAK